MSTYTCPHCGEHDLSTQKRHNCPKPPSLSIPLGPPRSRDPIANEYIDRLTRELDAAKEREKEYRHVLILLTSDEEAGIASTEYGEHCVYCFRESADLDPALLHEDDCPIERGRRALTTE